jgi:thiosulfate dehydrogenase [quinone] large subunit
MSELANDRLTRAGMAFARVVVGMLWLTQVVWKWPPDFKGLETWTAYAVSHPVFPPWSFIVENVVLPNITLFGWMTIVLEVSIAAFLLIGLATRFWALVGMGMTVTIILSDLNAPHEWSWAYYMMFTLHLAVLVTAAGRAYGIDGILRGAWSKSSSRIARIMEVSS